MEKVDLAEGVKPIFNPIGKTIVGPSRGSCECQIQYTQGNNYDLYRLKHTNMTSQSYDISTNKWYPRKRKTTNRSRVTRL